MPLLVGQIVNNRYQIKQVIGKTGSHVLYSAFDRAYQTEVAVRETMANTAEDRQAWLQRTILQSSLHHPNLMQVTDHFDLDETIHISVSNTAGSQSIQETGTNQKGMPIRTAVAAVLAICDAVNYLHHQQPPVIHGSIDIETVRSSGQGQTILVFPDWVVRQDDTYSGTARLISPVEQDDVDSLSALLLSILTGQPTGIFFQNPAEEDIAAILAGSPEPISASIVEFLRRGFRKEPANRYKSVDEFKVALLTSLISQPEPEQIIPSTSFRSTPINVTLEGSSVSDRATTLEPPPPPEIQQPSTPPIRRRVPWGLL